MQVALNSKISYELAAKLDALSKQSGVSKAKIIEMALGDYFAKLEKQAGKENE